MDLPGLIHTRGLESLPSILERALPLLFGHGLVSLVVLPFLNIFVRNDDGIVHMSHPFQNGRGSHLMNEGNGAFTASGLLPYRKPVVPTNLATVKPRFLLFAEEMFYLLLFFIEYDLHRPQALTTTRFARQFFLLHKVNDTGGSQWSGPI